MNLSPSQRAGASQIRHLRGAPATRSTTTSGSKIPNGVQPDGESPRADSYESRSHGNASMVLTRSESMHSIVDPHRLLEQGLN